MLDEKTRLRQCLQLISSLLPQAASSASAQIAAFLGGSSPSVCLSVPPLITSAGIGTRLLLSLLSLVIKELLTPSPYIQVSLIRPEALRYGLDSKQCCGLLLAGSHVAKNEHVQTEKEART